MTRTKETARKSTSTRYYGRRLAAPTVENERQEPIPEEPVEIQEEEEEEDPEEVEPVEEEEGGNDLEGQEEEYIRPARETYTLRSSGHEAGYMGRLLNDLLLRVNITSLPLYESKMVLRYRREEWMTKLTIYDGERVVSKHHSPIHRTTRREAESDAAWRAVTSLGYQKHEQLKDTSFTYVPRRMPQQNEYIIAPFEDGVTYNELSRLKNTTLEVSNKLTTLMQENARLRKRMLESENYLRAHIRSRVRNSEAPSKPTTSCYSDEDTKTCNSPRLEASTDSAEVNSVADDAISHA